MTVARYGLATTNVLAVAFVCASVSRHSEATSDQTSTSDRASLCHAPLCRALPSRAPQGWKARP